MAQASKITVTVDSTDNPARAANPDIHWKNARVVKGAGPTALEHSLAFHRLQEARQELHQARAESAAMSPRDRAKVLAHYEANLASAEQWVARTSEPKVIIAPPGPWAPERPSC